MNFKEWWDSVVMDTGLSGWIWKSGLIVSVLFIFVIIWGRVGPVHVRDRVKDYQVDHVQTVSVLDQELEEPTKAAIMWSNEHGCEFKYLDNPDLAEIVVHIEPNLICGGVEAIGCAAVHGITKEILVELPSERVIKHELLHHHNLQHPLAAPTGHIFNYNYDRVGDDDRGVAEACRRTRAY